MRREYYQLTCPRFDTPTKMLLLFRLQLWKTKRGRISYISFRVITEGKKLTDKEFVALQLIACKLANALGKIDSVDISIQDLQVATALNPKSLSSRLSELAKVGYVQKDNSDTGVKYRITTQGIHWLNSILSKKVKN